jgi:hypothetical protein
MWDSELENGARGSRMKEWEQSVETGKSKEVDSSRIFRNEYGPANTLMLTSRNYVAFDL